MLRVGLTGTRYSGKDTISNLFRQIKVPVFNADVILKYILKYEFEVLDKISDTIGYEYFKNGQLVSDEISKMSKFNDVLKVVKPYIFEAYSKFEKKHNGSVYTIFHSSILFESNWHKDMDKTINVNAPLDDRLKRLFIKKNIKDSFMKFDIEQSLKSENIISKNNGANIVIHNFGIFDVLDQVNKADNKIVNFYLKSKITNKKVIL